MNDGAQIAGIDSGKLMNYLGEQLAGDWSDIRLERITGGQSNPTFILNSNGRKLVLRKQPPGELLPSAHAIDREYRVMGALEEADIPVPAMVHFCSDRDVLGTPFYLMDFVEGRLFKDPLLESEPAADRGALYDAMNVTLAKLHTVDFAGHGLADYGRPGNYFARQIDRWSKQYRGSATGTIAAMDELMSRLPAMVPDDELATIVHGDYRLENLIFHPDKPEVISVLDWELSTLGHPLADLSYNCFPYHLPRKAFGGLADVALEGTGVPTEGDYIERYFSRTGIRPAAPWEFYMAFALFRLCAIMQGVLRRALDGQASSPDSLERGNLAGLCAEAGLAALDRNYGR